jgi:hypothetical protein
LNGCKSKKTQCARTLGHCSVFAEGHRGLDKCFWRDDGICKQAKRLAGSRTFVMLRCSNILLRD